MAQQDPSRFVRCLRMHLVSSEDGVELYETLEKSFPASLLTKNFAFGGVTAAQAVMAAFHSLHLHQGQQKSDSRDASAQASAIDKDWTIYSCLGNFLGPTTTTSLVRLEVTTLRSTRSFETRLVRAKQQQPLKKATGNAREGDLVWTTRFVSTVDFCRQGKHAEHPVTGDTLAFTVKPRAMQLPQSESPEHAQPSHFDPDHAESIFTVIDRLLKDGTVNAKQHKFFCTVYGTLPDCMEMRWLPGGLCERTLQGMRPDLPGNGHTSSDVVDASKNVDGVWMKTCGPLQDIWHDQAGTAQPSLPMTHAALAAAFRTMMLDPRPVVSAPLVHQLMFGQTFIGQSLDTAIRFHGQESEDDIVESANDFHYIETVSRVGGHGRYFGESSCFDRRGRLITTCSQQCSLQVLPGKGASVEPGKDQRHSKRSASKAKL